MSTLESRIESRISVDREALGHDVGSSSLGSSSGSISGSAGSAAAGGGGANSRGSAGGGSAGGGAGGSGDNNNARYYNNQASTVVVNLLRQNHIYARPLGNVIYMMPSLITPPGIITPSPFNLHSISLLSIQCTHSYTLTHLLNHLIALLLLPFTVAFLFIAFAFFALIALHCFSLLLIAFIAFLCIAFHCF